LLPDRGGWRTSAGVLACPRDGTGRVEPARGPTSAS